MAAKDFHFLRDRFWWHSIVTTAFGKSFWGFFAAAAAFGVLCWVIAGPEAVAAAIDEDVGLIADLMPRVLVALSIAALIWVLLPRDRLAALVGRESGLRGLGIATIAGMVTPGGPSAAYSLLAVLAVSGADRGPLVTYITAWALLGMQRILIWDVPFMGPEFAILRFVVCLPLPIVAGLIARQLPLTLRVIDPEAKERKA